MDWAQVFSTYICSEAQVEGAADSPELSFLMAGHGAQKPELHHTSTFHIMPANVSTAEASHIVKPKVSGEAKYILPTLVHYKVT